MTSEGFVLYKLIILYMLNRVDFPLSVSQISQFILELNSNAFFDLQIALNEMVENDYIKPHTKRNHTIYEITEQGMETIKLLDFKLDDSIKTDINNYLKSQKLSFRNESAISAEYYPSGNEYIVQCSIKEKKQTLLEIKLTVPDKDQAIHICDSWKNKNEQIYQYLINEIWRD
jgi:DNA-binding PadR family transcriptional regulator